MSEQKIEKSAAEKNVDESESAVTVESPEDFLKMIQETKEKMALMGERSELLQEKIRSHKKEETRLEEDCKTLKRTEEELESAQGKEKEKLRAALDSVTDKLQKNENGKVKAETSLLALEELEFKDWKAAYTRKEEAGKTGGD